MSARRHAAVCLLVTACATACAREVGPAPQWPTRQLPHPRSPAAERAQFYLDHRAEHWQSGGEGSVRFGGGEWYPFASTEAILGESSWAESELACRRRRRTGWGMFWGGLGVAALGGIVAGVGAALDQSAVTVTGLVGVGLGGAAFFPSVLMIPSDNACRPEDVVEAFNDWLWRYRLELRDMPRPRLTQPDPNPTIPLGR